MTGLAKLEERIAELERVSDQIRELLAEGHALLKDLRAERQAAHAFLQEELVERMSRLVKEYGNQIAQSVEDQANVKASEIIDNYNRIARQLKAAMDDAQLGPVIKTLTGGELYPREKKIRL